jgi:hypothetical protein
VVPEPGSSRTPQVLPAQLLAVPRAHERLEDGGADTAFGMMVLGNDKAAAGGRGGEDVGFDRLDEVQVDHPGLNPAHGQLICGNEAMMSAGGRRRTPHEAGRIGERAVDQHDGRG